MRMITPKDITVVSTNVPEDEYPAYDAGADYAVDAFAIYANHIWKALAINGPASTVVTPGTDPLVWQDEGATNAHKFYDKYWTTKTTHADLIDITVEVSNVDTLVLLNVTASDVDVDVINPLNDEIVESYNIPRSEIIRNPARTAFDMFFKKRSVKKELIVNMRVFPTVKVRIRLSNTSSTAELGMLIIGKSENLGHSKFGVSIEGKNWGKQYIAADGEPYLTLGNKSRRKSPSVFIENEYLDETVEAIESRYGIFTVFISLEGKSVYMVYGWVQNFNFVYANHTISEYTIQIEGVAK